MRRLDEDFENFADWIPIVGIITLLIAIAFVLYHQYHP